MLVKELIGKLLEQQQDAHVTLRSFGSRAGIDQDGYMPVVTVKVEPAYVDDNGLWKANEEHREGVYMDVIVLD